MMIGLGFVLGGLARGASAVYRQPALITSFGTGSSATFKLRGQARRKGYWIQVLAWNGVNTTAPVLPAGWTQIEARSGSSMAALLCGRYYQDGDPISFTFTNAGKVLYQAWSGVDAVAPIAGFAGRTQSTGGLTMTYPALARVNPARDAMFTRASGIRQNTPQILLPGWHIDSSTGSGAANLRWLSPDAVPVAADLAADVTTDAASNVQGMSWSVEMAGRADVSTPVYPWARAPSDGSFLAIGDSITYAADPTINYHERAFAIGSINLARNSGYNQGHSGWTSTQLVTQGSIVQTYGPSVVMLMIGTNDPTNGIAVETSQTNIRTMIDGYNGYGAQVILGTVLPNTNNQEAHRTALNDWIRQQTDVIVWDNNAIGFDPALHTGDGTHPNAAGATLLGTSLATILQGVDLIPNVPSGLLLALPQ